MIQYQNNLKGDRKMTQKDILGHYMKIGEVFSQILGKESKVIIREDETSNQPILAIFNGNHAYKKGNPETSDIQLLQNIQTKESEKEEEEKTKTTIKSIRENIKNEQGKVIGSITIEWDMTKINKVSDLLHEFIGIEKETPLSTLTSQDPRGTEYEIKAIIKHYTATSYNTQLNKKEQKEIIKILYQKGLFNNKDSVRIVANQLGVSKPTVYNKISQLKKRSK